MRKQFDEHYTGLLSRCLEQGKKAEDFVFDERLSILKSRLCQQITNVYSSLTPRDVIKSFEMCGIVSSVGGKEIGYKRNADDQESESEGQVLVDQSHNHN